MAISDEWRIMGFSFALFPHHKALNISLLCRRNAAIKKARRNPKLRLTYEEVCVCLFQHAKFLAHLDEGCNTLVEVLAVVTGRNLHGASSPILFRSVRRNQRLISFSFQDSLFQNTKFFTNLHEGGDALVEVLTLVTCGELYADAGLALRHNGIVESGNVDTLFLHLLCIHL